MVVSLCDGFESRSNYMKLSKYLGDKPFWQVTLRLADSPV